MAFENANTDLILGDPNGARIELLGNEAKIVCYDENNNVMFSLDGTAVFAGNPFSAISFPDTASGQPIAQIDAFQVQSGISQTGPSVRMAHYRAEDGQDGVPRVDFLPTKNNPADPKMNVGWVGAENDPAVNGASLRFVTPTDATGSYAAGSMRLSAANDSTGSALTIDVNEIRQGSGVRQRMLTQRFLNAATASPALAVANAAIAGTQVSVTTTRPNALYVIRGHFDFDVSVAGVGICIGSLNTSLFGLDGAVATFTPATTGRVNTSMEWQGALVTPGTYTFELMARKSAAGGTGIIQQNHTRIAVDIFE